MSRKTTLVLAASAAALLCGCRTDGGFGRRDNGLDWDFSTHALARQTKEDAQNTWQNVVTLPAGVVRSFQSAGRELSDTYWLYLETRLDK